jgi:hypothetical protein
MGIGVWKELNIFRISIVFEVIWGIFQWLNLCMIWQNAEWNE